MSRCFLLYVTFMLIAFHISNCVRSRHEYVFRSERPVKEQQKGRLDPPAASCVMSIANRLDCYPDGPTDPQKCNARNCCWKPVLDKANVKGIPWCFHPVSSTGGYNVTEKSTTTVGLSATLKRADHSPWPDDVMTLKLDVMYEETTRLHFKVNDRKRAVFQMQIRKRAAAVAVTMVCLEEKRRKRRAWKKKWLNEHDSLGAFPALLSELRSSDMSSYINFLRIEPDQFMELAQKIEPIIKKEDTNFRQAISTEERLAVTLRFLATGETYKSLSYLFRLGSTTIGVIVPETCKAIYTVLKDEYLKIYDPKKKRYEVPIETPKVTTRRANTAYRVYLNDSPFSIKVTRSSSGTVLFDSSSTNLTFADQFIEFGTTLSTSYIYGLGEHRQPLRIDPSNNPRLASWARDQPPQAKVNLYGDHAFYLALETNGDAFGVFLLNSNAKEVNIQSSPTRMLNYATTGGILDFYVFTGPNPNDVIRQYLDVIGYTYMPPYWSLGFHLCRWGYGGSDGLQKVITRMREAKMPFDTQWTDIDYMNKHLDWTFDHKNFAGLPDIVQDLHSHGQHYVMIIDPGISSTQQPGSYLPYDDGIKHDVFIKKWDGSGPIIGEVWPGNTAFPDFTNPATVDYWTRMAKAFHDQLPFDGLWTDMNEPSNFKFGSVDGCPANNSLDNPPYIPAIANGKLPDRTLCPSSQQYLSQHYNLHSMYGHFEGISTHQALLTIRQKRTLVISRSTFPSSGRFMGHWTGDNAADWENLYYSISAVLRFNMFGIPLVGADICGFSGDTTEELCVRWMQVGAFYPFMRNHNAITRKDQDPASPNFSAEGQNNMRLALLLRYTLIPYLYTLFYHSHSNGSTVARPLFFKYPKDYQTVSIDKQFMWGNELLISPVLEQGKVKVDAYFPVDTWYDFYSGIKVTETGRWVTLKAPLDTINVHVAGGSIIPVQQPNVTTTLSRQNLFGLLVAPDANGNSSGDLFWDDGDTIDTIEKGLYNFITFSASRGHLQARVERMGFPEAKMILGSVKIYGVNERPSTVLVNGNAVHFDYLNSNKVLVVGDIRISVLSAFTVTWS